MHCDVETYGSIGALPAPAAELFASPEAGDYFSTRSWYETVVSAGIPPGMAPCFAVAGDGLALLPLLADRRDRPECGMTTPYTCLFRPMVRAGISPDQIAAVGTAFGRLFAASGTARLDALASDDPLVSTIRATGLVATRFDHFGNWYEPVAGLDWAGYLAGRPGAVRETVRRKLRKAERDPAVRFEIVTGTDAVQSGIEAYESVYARSWKQPEPYPDFNATLIRAAARNGVLRLAILRVNLQPVATQLWVVSGGVASVLKLAHDEAFKAFSPGTVTTARMMQHLLDTEHVETFDFGRGDDPYKQLWTTHRRQRVGVVFANVASAKGAAHLARHVAGRAVRAMGRKKGKHADPL